TASGNLAPRTFSNSSAGPSAFASRHAISVTSYAQSTSRVTRFKSPRRSHSARKSDSVRKPVIAIAAPRSRRSLQLVLAPALAGVFAEQREQLVAEAFDEVVEAGRVLVPGGRDRHHDHALAREL